MPTSDVLIIGAGIAGASAAYEIQAFASTILLERESRPGYHATGRSAALYAPGYGNRVIRALTRASRRGFDERIDGLAPHPVLSPRGVLTVAPPEQLTALDRLEAELRPQLPDLRRLDAAELLESMPALRQGYAAAGLFDATSMDMDVAAIHEAYLRGFRRRGGRLVLDAEAVRITGEAGGPFRVETPAGVFDAAVVVDAAGAWADEVAALAGADPLGLAPMRRTAALLEVSIALEPHWPALEDAVESFYAKPESGQVLGSPADATPIAPGDVQAEELDVAQAVARIESACRLHVLRVRRKWAGLRTFAPDRTPVVGMDERLPGFFWLAGQAGYGIQTAPALARCACGLVVGGVLPDDVLALEVSAEDLMPMRLR